MTDDFSHDIKVIALTGGACSGKTAFLDKLKDKQGDFCGYRPLFVPEAATILASHGMRFQDGEKMFQRAILQLQMSMEDLYRRYASELDGKVCIICDRGTLDGAAYCGWDVFEELCEEEGTDRERLLERYDGVVYLVSAAIGAEEHYGCESNESRRESLDEAKELERKTIECWIDHPNIQVIGNEDGKPFEKKMAEAEGVLEKMLSR